MRAWIYRYLWTAVFCYVLGHPIIHAQQDFHATFLQMVAGKPFGQQTLLDIQNQLACAGSALTPPNAVGERTKIWDPVAQRWVRVGFGEGFWVWLYQDPAAFPVIQPCNAQPAPTPPPQPMPPDLGSLPQEVNSIHALVVQIANRNEELSKAERDAIAALDQHLTAHDTNPSWLRKYWPEIVAAISSFAGGWYVAK